MAATLETRSTQPSQDDPAAARRRDAEALLATVEGRRERLESLRLRYLRRLHRASDDFEATEALRVVERAMSMIPYAEDPREERRRAHRARRHGRGER